MMERVVLVDEKDNPLGTMEKMEAHEKGVLHRAFSVFIFNNKGDMLLQQRAFSKYHSGGLWTNTCCSHPRDGETTLEAAHRRLQEEMGFDCEIEKAFDFIYKKNLDKGLIEHEFDHVFIGEFEGEVCFNKEEVNAYIYRPVQAVVDEVNQTPEKYTEWFKICLDEVVKRIL